MSKTNGNVPQLINVVEEEAARTGGATRRVLLAALGLVSWGQDQLDGLQTRVEETFADLVERGEGLEKDGRQMLDEMAERRRSQAKEANEKLESGMEQRVEALLTRLNVPTRDDIKELGTKLNSLNRKIDDLKKAREGTKTAA